MWQYRMSPRPDELYHAASKSGKQYKYIRKYKNSNGKWVYVYKKPGALTENHNQNAPTLGQRIGQIKSDLKIKELNSAIRESKAAKDKVFGPDYNNKGTSNFNKTAKKIVTKSNDISRDKDIENKAKDISQAFDEFVDLFKKNLKNLK